MCVFCSTLWWHNVALLQYWQALRDKLTPLNISEEPFETHDDTFQTNKETPKALTGYAAPFTAWPLEFILQSCFWNKKKKYNLKHEELVYQKMIFQPFIFPPLSSFGLWCHFLMHVPRFGVWWTEKNSAIDEYSGHVIQRKKKQTNKLRERNKERK